MTEHLKPFHKIFISSFFFCRESSVFSLSLLLTDGEGSAVRLWNRCVTSHPTAVLGSHHTTVVDVVIQQALAKIFSYSKDAVSFFLRKKLQTLTFPDCMAAEDSLINSIKSNSKAVFLHCLQITMIIKICMHRIFCTLKFFVCALLKWTLFDLFL